MKRLIGVICLIILTIQLQAQPSGYVEGTERALNVGFGHWVGYFRAVGWNASTDHVLIFFGGDGQQDADTNTIAQAAPASLLVGAGHWNGVTTLPNSTTRKWLIITLNDYGYDMPTYKFVIEYVFAHAGVTIDTTTTAGLNRIHYCGISGGPGRMLGWLTNDQSHNSPLRTKYSTSISASCTSVGVDVSILTGKKHWVWFGTADANPGTLKAFSYNLYGQFPGTAGTDRIIDSTVGGTHSNSTWGNQNDSLTCFGVTGHSEAKNRFIWMIQEGETLGGANQPPVANAGIDQTITLPTTTATLSGSGTDADGSIASYAWSKLSGPSGGSITSPSSASTGITSLQQGTYTYRLTVTDNLGATGTDNIIITVNPIAGSEYIVGTQFYKKLSNRDFMVFLPDTSKVGRPHLIQYFIYNMIDSTGKDTTYAKNLGLCKKIANGWNGKQPLCSGDTAVFNVITQVNNPTKKDTMEVGMQWALDSLPHQVFDTTHYFNNILAGIGGGAVSNLTYLMDKFSDQGQSGALKFRKAFSKIFSIDFSSNSIVSTTAWGTVFQPLFSWWFAGTSNGFPYNTGFTIDAFDSALIHQPSSGITKLSQISGQNYSTLTHDSAFSSVGLDASNNAFLWFTDPFQCEDTTVPKIILDSTMIYDFSDAWGKGAYSTFFYFDSKADPVHGNLINDSTTGNTSIGASDYYIDNYRSQRLIWINLQKRYRITQIWVNTSPGCDLADTVQVHLGSDSCKSFNYIANFKNSTITTTSIITIGGSYSWKKVYENKNGGDTTQYALVNVHHWTKTGPSDACETNITGIIFYGYLVDAGETKFNYDTTGMYSIDTAHHQDIRNLTGVNTYNLYPMADQDSFTVLRQGINNIFMFSNDTLVRQPAQNISSRDFLDSSLSRRMPGREMYYNFQGPTTKVYNQTSGDFLQRPVDSIGADRRNIISYTTMGTCMYNYGYAFGSNNSANPAFVKQRNANLPGRASGSMKAVEVGNETNSSFFPNLFMDAISQSAEDIMCIDGAGGAFPGKGVKTADPNMKYYISASAGYDIQWQRARLKLLQLFYNTTHPPIDGIIFHGYPSAAKKTIGLTSDENIGNYVINPSAEGYYQDLIYSQHALYAEWHGFVPIIYNEYGADKSFLRTKTANGFFDTTTVGTVQYGSFDQEQSLGILQVSFNLMYSSTSAAQTAVYSFIDNQPPNPAFKYTGFSGSGFIWYYYHFDFSSLDSTKYFKQYYYFQGVMRSLFGYKCVQILDSNSNGLWRLKFRKISDPTKVCYVVWNDNPNNANISTSLSVGTVLNATINTANFNSFNLTSNSQIVSGGAISSITANNQHKLFFMTELITNNVKDYFTKKKKGRIRFTN